MEEKKEEFFSPQRRFSATINSHRTVVLDKDYEVFGKALRTGAVLRIIGTREIAGLEFFVVNKGTWESLFLCSSISHLIQR
jgi:hypothetical protein